MKTATTLPTPALSYKPRVKKFLIRATIYLTSEKFITFAGVIGALCTWWGVCTDNNYRIATGAIILISSFAPWAWRQTARDLRQDRLGIKKW